MRTLTFVFLLFTISGVIAQPHSEKSNQTITDQIITVSIDSANITGLSLGDSITISVTLSDIEPGNSIQVNGYLFSISFDKNILTLVGTENFYSGFVGSVEVGAFEDSLNVIWLNPNFCLPTIYEGETIFDIKFTYNGGLLPGENSPIAWENCQVINGVYDWFNLFSIDGLVFMDNLSSYPNTYESDKFFQVWSGNRNLYIDNKSNTSGKISLYDITGKLIGNSKLQKGLNSIYTSGSANIYFVKIQNEDSIFTRKVFLNN